MSTNTLDDLLAGGGKTAKFETIGQSYTGVVEKAEPRQATNFDTGKPEFWDDGKPKMQVVVNIKTAERTDADDDGVRAVYINAWGDKLKALREASRQAGGSPAPGDTFTATYIGDGEKPARGYAPKLFRYEIKKGSPIDAVIEPQATASAPAATAAPAAPAIDAAKEAQIRKLIELSLTDEQIAKAIGVFEAEAAAVRVQVAADSSKGF